MFALPQHIEPYLSDVLAQLPREHHLQRLDRALLARLTHYLAEINAAHPFREGNGRAQRAFVGQLPLQTGHRIDWQHLDPTRNTEASRAAHRGDNAPLHALLSHLTFTPEHDEITRLRDAAFPQAPARCSPRGSTDPPRARTSPPRRPPTRGAGR